MVSERHLRLRKATESAHQALEQTPLMRALVSAQLNETGYLSVIRVLHGFWQAYLKPGHPAVDCLSADLKSFPAETYAPHRLPDERIRHLQEPEGPLARDYLLLGSNLGGTVICRHLTKRFGEPWVAAHARHFASASHSGIEAWRAYLDQLAAADLTPAQEQRLAETACGLFEDLRQHTLQEQERLSAPTSAPGRTPARA